MHQWRRGRVGGVVGLVLLVACSPDAAEEAEAYDPWAPGPFEELIAAELGETEETIQRLDHQRREATVAECMARDGFEYFPAPEPVVMGYDTYEEWAEELRTTGWSYFSWGAPVQEEEREPTQQEVYQESLQGSALKEYERALHGEWDPATGEPVEGSEGCYHAAFEEARGPYEQFEDVIGEIRDAWRVAEEDPEVRAARDEYRDCMSVAGFPGISIDPAELLDAWMQEELGGGPMSSDDPRVAKLAEREVQLANAHLDCQAETDVAVIATRATHRVAGEILERRADEVEAYVAAVREHYGLE